MIVLATYPPQYAGSRGAGAPYVSTLNGKFATLAVGSGVTLVDLYKDFAAAGTRLIGVDGLHPSEAGYTQMATSFNNAIAARFETKKVTVQPTSQTAGDSRAGTRRSPRAIGRPGPGRTGARGR